MSEPKGRNGSGLTRREALKRAAVVGGAIWAAPVVQTIGAGRAWASHASCPFRFWVKFEVDEDTGQVDPCDSMVPGPGDGEGHCFPNAELLSKGVVGGGCNCGVTAEFDNLTKTMTVTLPQGTFADEVRIKCGTECQVVEGQHGSRVVTAQCPAVPGAGMSQIEVVFCSATDCSS